MADSSATQPTSPGPASANTPAEAPPAAAGVPPGSDLTPAPTQELVEPIEADDEGNATENDSTFDERMVPLNVKFEIDDVESPWIDNKKYDFIMCRYMVASIRTGPASSRTSTSEPPSPGRARFPRDSINQRPRGGSQKPSKPRRLDRVQDVNTKFYSEDGAFTDEHATAKWMDGFSKCSRRIKAPLGPWAKEQHHRDVGVMRGGIVGLITKCKEHGS